MSFGGYLTRVMHGLPGNESVEVTIAKEYQRSGLDVQALIDLTKARFDICTGLSSNVDNIDNWSSDVLHEEAQNALKCLNIDFGGNKIE